MTKVKLVVTHCGCGHVCFYLNKQHSFSLTSYGMISLFFFFPNYLDLLATFDIVEPYFLLETLFFTQLPGHHTLEDYFWSYQPLLLSLFCWLLIFSMSKQWVSHSSIFGPLVKGVHLISWWFHPVLWLINMSICMLTTFRYFQTYIFILYVYLTYTCPTLKHDVSNTKCLICPSTWFGLSIVSPSQ